MMKTKPSKKTNDYVGRIEMRPNDYKECSCLDSAYERRAIDQGLVLNPVFPENIQYMKEKQHEYPG